MRCLVQHIVVVIVFFCLGNGAACAAAYYVSTAGDDGADSSAAINLAYVRDSFIANNLIFNNYASGIASRDDGQENEYGTQNNVFANNTGHMPSDGRWALSLKNGSINNTLTNNILLHEGSYRGGLEFTADSLPGLQSDNNILARIDEDETVITLSQWQAQYSQDAHSTASHAIQAGLHCQ